jgi:hypothetical protein
VTDRPADADADADEAADPGGASGTAGLPDPDDVPDDEIADIERDREQRLDPDNRPEGTEIDNTTRTFDPAAGRFTDDPEHDPGHQPYVGEE